MVSKKKIIVGKEGTDLKEWQARFAADWIRYINHPSFQAGIQFLRNRKLERVALLNEEQIEKNGRELLADLRGYLQHENELLTLHEMTDFTLPFEDTDVYLSPDQQADHAKLIEKFQEENTKKRYAS